MWVERWRVRLLVCAHFFLLLLDCDLTSFLMMLMTLFSLIQMTSIEGRELSSNMASVLLGNEPAYNCMSHCDNLYDQMWVNSSCALSSTPLSSVCDDNNTTGDYAFSLSLPLFTHTHSRSLSFTFTLSLTLTSTPSHFHSLSLSFTLTLAAACQSRSLSLTLTHSHSQSHSHSR